VTHSTKLTPRFAPLKEIKPKKRWPGLRELYFIVTYPADPDPEFWADHWERSGKSADSPEHKISAITLADSWNLRTRRKAKDQFLIFARDFAYERPKFPRALREFCHYFHCCDSNELTAHLAISESTHEIVGAFFTEQPVTEVNAAGTWVAGSQRRRGIADELWKHALAYHASPIRVTTATDAGENFVLSMIRRGWPVIHESPNLAQ